MTVKRFLIVPAVLLLLAIGYAALLFAPKNNGTPYRLVVEKGQGMAAVGRKLAADDKIYSRYVLVSAAYALGVHDLLGGFLLGKFCSICAKTALIWFRCRLLKGCGLARCAAW